VCYGRFFIEIYCVVGDKIYCELELEVRVCCLFC